MYKKDELVRIREYAEDFAEYTANDIFEKGSDFKAFIDQVFDLRLEWIFVPKTICAKIVNEADLHSKHISQKESDREIGRLKKMVQ